MENAQTDRFGSFFKRVETERAALKIVNNAFPTRKLHGLTAVAIEAWKDDDVLPTSCRDEIAKILLALAARIDALADQSRVVFAGETFNLLASHELLVELENASKKLTTIANFGAR